MFPVSDKKYPRFVICINYDIFIKLYRRGKHNLLKWIESNRSISHLVVYKLIYGTSAKGLSKEFKKNIPDYDIISVVAISDKYNIEFGIKRQLGGVKVIVNYKDMIFIDDVNTINVSSTLHISRISNVHYIDNIIDTLEIIKKLRTSDCIDPISDLIIPAQALQVTGLFTALGH
jgi:hypothetical protein